MVEWWEALSSIQRVFCALAIPATVILVLQTILSFFGIGDGHDCDGGCDGALDADPDVGSDGLTVFSLRGITAFFALGGWAGVMAAEAMSPVLSVLIALAVGTAALIGIAFLFRAMMRLQSSGNVRFENAVGHTAKVYITVPAAKQDFGKVTLTVQERFLECDAVTPAPSDLKTGALVRVTGVLDESTLIVEPMEESDLPAREKE